MHSILEGVQTLVRTRMHRLLFTLKWMQELYNRLLAIRPPQFVPRIARSIYSWNLWRANEFLPFLLFYSLPIFLISCRSTTIKIKKKLVIFLVVLKRDLSCSKLAKAQDLIEVCERIE